MKNHPLNNAARREFLRRSGTVAAVGGAAPFALNLAAIAEAAAQSTSDYKALVCVFLYGGADYGNTLIPYDTASHAKYAAIRRGLGVGRDALAATALTSKEPLTGFASQMALGPGMAAMKPLWDSGKMAAILNIGTLTIPTTKTQYRLASHPKPPRLFSHNDQASLWQTLTGGEGATSGWGGRLGDLFASSNGNAAFTGMSVTGDNGFSGNSVYMSGRSMTPYNTRAGGSATLGVLSANLLGQGFSTTMRQLITASNTNSLLAKAHMEVVARALNRDGVFREALAASPMPAGMMAAFPANKLGDQLKTVAQTIAARQTLGVNKQVFFCSLNGWDTHDNSNTRMAARWGEVASALAAFQNAMDAMGLSRNVTTFTASDFGRALTQNGSGTDHGWGGHQFVIGGAVDGQRFVGSAPEPASNGANDVGNGRLLPDIAVDQLAAELARWMGVSEGNLRDIVPGAPAFSRIKIFA